MSNDDREKPAHAYTCPICGKAGVAAWRPFCSKRCADVDLGRWLHGGYAIPGEPAEQSERPEPEAED